MSRFPLRHVSARVPWHDSAWQGTVCAHPALNGACAKLKGIAGSKSEESERLLAGQRLTDLPNDKWPPCISERGTFMAPFEMDQIRRHALATPNSEHYGHFEPTPQRYPPYSAGIVPFRWLMRDQLDELANRLEIDVDSAREPDVGYDTNWVHEAGNQRAVLDAFAGHLREEESLIFFYAKHVPFVEGTGRVLVGVGRVKHIGELIEYRRSREGMPGMVWERPIQHSIRPNGEDGLLMPYHQILARAATESKIDVEAYVAHAPTEHWDEFSYGSELVTHDGAISALLAMDVALDRIQRDLGIETELQRRWLHDELIRLWKVRGPFPGLGAVLHAFGLSRGVFVAHALQERVGTNADPWPAVDEAFRNPEVLPAPLRRDLKELEPTWRALPEKRRKYLRLISRFELRAEQADSLYEESSRARCGWVSTDDELLANPYRVYEVSRHDPEGVHYLTIDRGVFPDEGVRLLHPLDAPSGLDSAIDVRRVRAFTIATLETAASAGHTLQFASDVVEAIRQMPLKPECPVTSDILSAAVTSFAPEILAVVHEGPLALQLGRYQRIGDLIRKNVLNRIKGTRHSVAVDWSALLAAKFGPTKDEEESRAREEKAKALAELAESRFAVLAGPAGAGKTTVLGFLCAHPAVQADGLLLLAPTGKARVRMQQLATGAGAGAQTVAQFLNSQGRYDGKAGRYIVTEGPKATGFGTVIVDEASMLTEDMLGALFDALQGVKRFILVGDPAQLPPIGAGRPFVDIIARLRPQNYEHQFPRIAPGYAELTIERRQIGTDRPDLRLARWFSANPPGPGEDEIFSMPDSSHPALRFVSWEGPEEFQRKLLDVLVQELALADDKDERGFDLALGATRKGEYQYFNRTRQGNAGSVSKVEAWQILSPLRGMPFGVSDINRQLQARFRAAWIEFATRQWNRSIPQPLGAERIVYGSKVINLSNHRRDGRRVYPEEGALGYLANGEIGIVVGMWKTNGYPKVLKVEFSSQPGHTYAFCGSDFREESDAALELAYALTVHKAQGSQFKLVIVVLPEGHPILSRELIYTALTRHENRVVVMHQGSRSLLKEFTSPHRSETARRKTNLLSECRMVEIPQTKGSVFLQEGLIHRTSKGQAMRSKSELLIAEAMISAGVAFEYEKPLTLGGVTRYPDFTIEDEISGRTIYWEHLGLLSKDEYRQRWEAKRAWYIANGVQPIEKGANGASTLVTTADSPEGGLDMSVVKKLLAEVCSG